MTLLKIYKVEDYELKNPVSTLIEGEHVIGRGDLLACNDKKVSRKHALINVTEDGAFITSVHVNPCFFRPSGGCIQILPRNESTPINNDDQFALLSSSFWFKCQVVKEKESTDDVQEKEDNDNKNAQDEPASSSKRCNDEPEHANKKQKRSSNENLRKSRSRSNSLDDLLSIPEAAYNINPSNTTVHNGDCGNDENRIEDESNKKSTSDSSLNVCSEYGNAETMRIEDVVKKETVSEDEEEQPVQVKKEPENDKEPQIKTEPDATSDAGNQPADDDNDVQTNNAGDTGVGNQQNQPVRREKCWYGANCYRRNPQHRATFCHPGDPDHRPDSEDARPDCPFGATCYQTNITHRRQYKHIAKPAPKPSGTDNGDPQTPKKKTPRRKKQQNNDDDDLSNDESDESDDSPEIAGTRKKRKAALTKKKYVDTPEDDYDLNDPFVDDGTDDEFKISDDSDGNSDWDDSQEADEESQETRRMLKEAKKFTKRQKKGKKK